VRVHIGRGNCWILGTVYYVIVHAYYLCPGIV
jgi:hypothetical protein